MLQSSINAIMAIGMTLVVMAKGIDLSVGSVVGLSSMVAASQMSLGIGVAAASGVAVGLGCGFLNGLIIAKLRLPDFIVTLGTMSIFRGAALIYNNGQPFYEISDRFRAVFAGDLWGAPTPVIFTIAIALIAYFIVRFTTLGEHIIAVGGNEEAAQLSGIAVDWVKVSVYVMSGVLSAIAGFVLIARIGAAEPIGGTGFELQAIGAAVIGGASLFGGEGNPLGALVGALTLGSLTNGLTLLNVQSFWQYVASGVVGVVLRDELAVDSLVMTRNGVKRICRAAFELARKRQGAPKDGKRRVTCCDKSNILRTYAFFRKIFDEVAADYPDVEADYALADAMTVHLVERPEFYDVIVTENMFGDIISDLAAATVGGMGMSPSSELGDKHGFFQAAHGSAPTIAGKGIANPYGTILSAASMLNWLGGRHDDMRLSKAGAAIERAVEAALADNGKYLTVDLGGAARTRDVADGVRRHLS
jgi:ribose/xylose/arabinose/galactoside ABC-type transport system permease subunit